MWSTGRVVSLNLVRLLVDFRAMAAFALAAPVSCEAAFRVQYMAAGERENLPLASAGAACQLCSATRGARTPVLTRRPPEQVICLHHRRWLGLRLNGDRRQPCLDRQPEILQPMFGICGWCAAMAGTRQPGIRGSGNDLPAMAPEPVSR